MSARCSWPKAAAVRRPSSRSMVRNAHSALSLDDSPRSFIIALWMRWMRMRAQRAPSPWPASTTCRSTAIIRSSLSSTALNETSFIRLAMSRAVRGVSVRATGLIWTSTVSRASLSRISGVSVGLPLKPPSQ